MAPPAAPRRLQRLDSLRKPGLLRRASISQPVIKKACCDNPKIEEEDGSKVCKNCFTQISESNIVADITFQEDSRGAATVQGGFIGENARHARTLGSAAYRRVGGGEKNSIQEIEANGRRELAALCPRLAIPENVSMQAANIWSLAAKQNFTAGRRTDEVIAACLYAACRRQKENTVLLMDISEHQKINVFRLGEVYKDLCKDLFLDTENNLGFQRLIEIEPLILKYCRNLEFGEKTRQVAEDAVKIIRRMKRDWIVTGRHPAGLCGGAIILAARMNNFRRSVREVVYVAKVADVTIAKRMEEFRRTKVAGMTVEQFREYGTRIKDQADPPAMMEAELMKQRHEKKKRKRQEYIARRDSEAASTESQSEGGSPKRARTETTPTQPEPRFDADGFAIPALPSPRPAQTEKPATRRKSKKDKKPDPILNISPEELEDEQELENEIEEFLDDQQMIDTQNEVQRAKLTERSTLLANAQRDVDAERIKARRDMLGMTWFNGINNDKIEVVTEAELEAEFADDPEVMNCKLSDEEIKMKERIWVTFNEDWLRTQHEKELLAKINEATSRKDQVKKPTKAKKKKRGKMGDGSLLAEAVSPIETPADANAAMLAKHAPLSFSRYVNYEALSKVYGGNSRSGSEAPSAASSQVGSPSRAATPASSRASPEQEVPSRTRIVAGRPTPQSSARNATQSSQARETEVPNTPPATNELVDDGADDEFDEDDEDEVQAEQDYDEPYEEEEENPYRDYGGYHDAEDDEYSRTISNVGEASLSGTWQ